MSVKFTPPSMHDASNFDVLPICKEITFSSIIARAREIHGDCHLPICPNILMCGKEQHRGLAIIYYLRPKSFLVLKHARRRFRAKFVTCPVGCFG